MTILLGFLKTLISQLAKPISGYAKVFTRPIGLLRLQLPQQQQLESCMQNASLRACTVSHAR